MIANRVRKISLWIGSLGLLACMVLFGTSILIDGVMIAGSERTVYERAASPDGWHEARVQYDDFGATSSFSRLMFIKHRWNLSDAPVSSCRAFWGQGEEAVHLRWLDNSTLLITHRFPPRDVKAVTNRCGRVRIVVAGLNPKGSSER